MDQNSSSDSTSVKDNQQETSSASNDMEGVTSSTTESYPSNFNQSTNDDIRALTEALTTPLQEIVAKAQSDTPEASVTTGVNSLSTAVAAAVAAATAGLSEHSKQEAITPNKSQDQEGSHSLTNEVPKDSSVKQDSEKIEVPNNSSMDLSASSVYNQVLSLTSPDQKPAKRSADEAFEQNEAAIALQRIALSLSNPSAATDALAAAASPNPVHEPTATSETISDATNTRPASDGTSKEHDTETAVSDTLMSISRAINFPATTSSNIEADTEAFTRAVISATQSEANKGNINNVIPQAENGQGSGGLEHTALQSLSLQPNYTSEGNSSSTSQVVASATTSAPSSSNQAFTFEYDKETGKTQLKWTPDPRDQANNDASAKAIEQAFATIIANLSQPNDALLPPPLGPFPVQGSEFGTAQDLVKAESAPNPQKRRRAKPSTSKSTNQHTAASIPEGAPSFPCDFPGCDKVFARLYNLKSHSRTHTDERPFVCDNCQLAFARNHDLKRHIKIHIGDKSFLCNGCGKSFSRLDALRRHRANSKNRPGCEATEAHTS
ncbi:hypothetical protein BGZ76_006045 [Entomortierella beljakovae]|nr:hypothetical protein BGZ76_006045 [Entomortierella beljakovae]